MGQARIRGGRVMLGDRDLTRLASERRARLGLGWVPQERNIFRSLTVEENLTAVARPGPWTVDRVYRMFPRLRERRPNMGAHLTGDEQQMLAVGPAPALNPRLPPQDEPLQGPPHHRAADLAHTPRRPGPGARDGNPGGG